MYELSNPRNWRGRHLGNVLSTVSDRKLAYNASPLFYIADVLGYTDYYPFGMTMPGRNANPGSYSHGFNGMEKDDELKGSGHSYDFGARIYDPRLGRWLAVDPLSSKYPFLSSYVFTSNNPILLVDPDGRIIVLSDASDFDENGNSPITSMISDAFTGKVAATIVAGAAGNRLNISLAEGVTKEDFTPAEWAIYENIQFMVSKTNTDVLTITSLYKSPEGIFQVDNYGESAIYKDKFDLAPDGIEDIGKLASLDHFFSEQWAGKKNGADRGSGRFASSHEKALKGGAKRFGYSWQTDWKNTVEGKLDVVDLFDRNGNYTKTLMFDYTQEDSPVVRTSYIKVRDEIPKFEKLDKYE